MQIHSTVPSIRSAIREARGAGKRIGFVPTMGFLHDGHLSLVDSARAAGCDFIVVSIFVNPAQFGPREDFSRYPRNEAGDKAQLESRGVDALFLPPVEVVYPYEFVSKVIVAGVSEPLEGDRRPGHFDGVATVVLKLFNIVQPDVAVFGRKDAQQCAVVARMVRDLDIPVELVFGETIREADGLAMSSRNSYLSSAERALAPRFHEALVAGATAVRSGGAGVEGIETAMKKAILACPGIEIDYLRLVDPETFAAPKDLDRDLLLVGAVKIGSTRLIDNIHVPRASGRRQHGTE
jgi:pantoate--beta-alanine ligase